MKKMRKEENNLKRKYKLQRAGFIGLAVACAVGLSTCSTSRNKRDLSNESEVERDFDDNNDLNSGNSIPEKETGNDKTSFKLKDIGAIISDIISKQASGLSSTYISEVVDNQKDNQINDESNVNSNDSEEQKRLVLPSFPTKPVDSTDPTKPADPTKPTDPTKPADPTKPTKPGISVHTHNWEVVSTSCSSNNNGTHTITTVKKCSCGKTITSIEGKSCSYGNWTSMGASGEKGVCSACGHQTTRAHSIKESTSCTYAGGRTHNITTKQVCSTCNYTSSSTKTEGCSMGGASVGASGNIEASCSICHNVESIHSHTLTTRREASDNPSYCYKIVTVCADSNCPMPYSSAPQYVPHTFTTTSINEFEGTMTQTCECGATQTIPYVHSESSYLSMNCLQMYNEENFYKNIALLNSLCYNGSNPPDEIGEEEIVKVYCKHL